MRSTRLIVAGAVTALAAAGTLAASPSDAAPAAKPKVLAKHLVAPLSLAVASDGTAYVTQNFAGALTEVGAKKALYQSQGGNEVGGVSERKGTIVFTETKSGEDGEPVDSWVKVLGKHGKAKTLAHVRAYENKANPDGDIVYGARGISDECAAQWPTEQLGPATHSGVADSHPYATYQTKKTVYVADAGMNAVLAISRSGRIRTVAVPPPAPVEITAGLAAGAGVPDCAVGLTYYSESVPTDVAMGPDGKLYVTTEGGGLGEQLPLGTLDRIDPKSGKIHQIAGGLFAAAGVAVSDKGDAYVSQLFGGSIVKIKKGSSAPKPFAHVGLPAAVEISGKHLYATINVLPPETGAPNGKVARFHL